MNHNLLTVSEIAKHLRVPRSWIYSKTRETGSDSIPRIKVGKYLRFKLEDVMSWIEEKQTENTN